jgi:hypothetical protein
LPQIDHFFDLPHPGGRGQMPIGREAEEKLRHLAYGVLVFNGLENTVSRPTIRKLLGETLVQRFIVERRAIDERQIARLISFLGREAKKACSTRKHFVPCHLLYVQEPPELPAGPVIFRTRQNFQSQILRAVRDYDKGEGTGWASHMAGSLHYYRGFKWVAEVPVTSADEETSLKIAMEAARAAVNGLHIALGAQATNKMTIGGPRILHDRRSHLHFSDDGKLQASLSSTGPGNVGFSTGWSKGIPDSGFRHFLDLIGIALEAAVNPNLQRPLSRRLLDAIYWFGEAVRESTDAARIVKYVTALERMMMTQERDDIAGVVSDRVAAFIWIDNRSKTLAEWKAVVARLYDLRSRLVHGDMSPGAMDVSENVGTAAHITRMSILSALHHFGATGMRAEKVPRKQLGAWFDNIVSLSKEPNFGAGPV